MNEVGPEVPPRRTQQKRSEGTRAKLIEAAVTLISDEGMQNFTTAKVAEAAGLTRGAIQYHFKNPKDLLREVVANIVYFLGDQLDEANLSVLDKTERLERIVELYWKGYRSDRYVVFIELALHGRLDPELKETVAEALSDLEVARDDQWLALFADYDQSDEELLDWRASLLMILRGLALKQVFSENDIEIQNMFQQARESYIREIQFRSRQKR